jgi:two-component system sensor histidine kinase HydH
MIIDRKGIFSLIIGRLVVATTLLVAAVVIQFSTVSFLPLGPFYALLLGYYGLSLFYLALGRWDHHYRFQAYLQIVCDLFMITGIVYISGGISGDLYFLYVFAIIAASLLLSARAAYLTASLAAILFGLLADGMYYGLIPYFREDQHQDLSLGLVLYTIFLAWAIFFLITFLVNRLARSLLRTREALAGAHRELELKERQAAAGRMSALIAHEIRNPLAAISGAVQVLKGDLGLDAEKARLMDIVVGESRRVSQSIDQFLNLASPGTQDFRVFDMSELLRETLVMLRLSGELNGQHSVQGNFETAKVGFYGNPSQFKQIFWNLARNALQAMPDGGTLTLDFDLIGKNQVSLRFADTGKGMTAEEKKRMFEPFYSKFEGGRGLGLAVVRKIVEDFDGKIRVLSEPNRGTEIVITLPALKTERISNP